MLRSTIQGFLFLKATAESGMKNKPTQKPTAKWVFWCFIGIHELSINSETTGILNIKEHHKVILNCLGDKYWDVYS